jgi:hypothetical protein
MAKLNKGIISPVIESKHGFVFHTGGQNFKMTGSHIEKITNVSEDFKSLVEANSMFNITNEGISFYYDYNNKKTISNIDESALTNFDKLVSLNDKIDFLNENIKSYSISGKTLAVVEVKKELELLESTRTDLLKNSIIVNFSYNVAENKFYAGTLELSHTDSTVLSESLLASAYIKYEDKEAINLFEFASKNYKNYNVLDFINESSDGDVNVLAMRADNNMFVYKYNESTKIDKFTKLDADKAVEYVAETTGVDITSMVEDILESYKERRASELQKTETLHEMIAFLKDQKGILSEADRNLPDIKAADQLLNSEIKRITEELRILEDGESLNKDDGYVTAETTVESKDLPVGTKVKVDALEFTGKGKSDTLTVFVDGEPLRIEKNKLQLSVEDSI